MDSEAITIVVYAEQTGSRVRIRDAEHRERRWPLAARHDRSKQIADWYGGGGDGDRTNRRRSCEVQTCSREVYVGVRGREGGGRREVSRLRLGSFIHPGAEFERLA